MCAASKDLCIPDLEINQKDFKWRLGAAQRNMERAIIGVSWHDHRTNECLKEQNQGLDIMHVFKPRTWTWASHIARLQRNRWTSQVTDWRPMNGSRPRGRPSKKCMKKPDAFWRSVAWK